MHDCVHPSCFCKKQLVFFLADRVTLDLTDGPDRGYQIGNTALAFAHTALKESGIELKESGLIVQALKSLGHEQITPEIISKIRAWLPEPLRARVLADTKTTTGWAYSAIQQITQEAVHG